MADYHERNFVTQVLALSRKKMLVMTRDRRSFLMDTLFPSLLMALGLYLTTVELLSEDYPTRALVPAGFPTPQPLIYNRENFN